MSDDKFETVEEFLARGGEITHCKPSLGMAPAYTGKKRSGSLGDKAMKKRAPRVVKTVTSKNSKYEV